MMKWECTPGALVEEFWGTVGTSRGGSAPSGWGRQVGVRKDFREELPSPRKGLEKVRSAVGGMTGAYFLTGSEKARWGSPTSHFWVTVPKLVWASQGVFTFMDAGPEKAREMGPRRGCTWPVNAFSPLPPTPTLELHHQIRV